MTYRLDGLYVERLIPLCELCGLRPTSDAEARRRQAEGHDETERTAIHEAGHALVSLVEGVEFYCVGVTDAATGALVHRRPVPPGTIGPPLATRIALELGGAAAEEAVFGDVSPCGAWIDLAMALARAGVPRSGVATADHRGVRAVRAQAERLRGLFVRERAALDALARELTAVRTLRRVECVAIVRGLGIVVDDEHKYELRSPRAEDRRVMSARSEIKATQEARRL